MNKTLKKIAVTFVTALLICGVSLTAFAVDGHEDGIFFVTNNYPNAESLIYGASSLVVDINYNVDYPDIVYYRFQASADSIYWVTRIYNNDRYYYTLHICSNNPIYSYTCRSDTGYNSTATEFSKGSAYGYEYYYYESVFFATQGVFHCYGSKKYEVPSNLVLGDGVVLVVPKVCDYPTITDIKNNQNFDKINDTLNEGFTALDNRLQEGFSSINNGVTQAVNDILNAGSDMPSLDTDNSWMNDSLTKVNEWVSSIDAFKVQMQSAKEENAENMQQAKAFINGFFEVLPTTIIAILTLGLVVIVVVKVIGR